MSKEKVISIIAPCYNEEVNILSFYEKILKVFCDLESYTYELIFADDSSDDKTVELIKNLAKKDKKVKLVVNANNHGVYKNSFNAIKYATGAALVPVLPVDLQDPPELINEFIKNWEMGSKIVIGTRKERNENFFMRLIRSLYYKIVDVFSDRKLVTYGGEFGLIDKTIYKQLLNFDDYYPYTRGLIASLSNNISTVPYTWQKRSKGKSNYTIFSYYDHAVNGLISTSRNLLRRIIFVGIISSFFVFIGLIYQFVNFIFFDKSLIPPGTLTILLLLTFLLIFLLVTLSFLSEYIVAIHSQVRNNIGIFEKETVNINFDN